MLKSGDLGILKGRTAVLGGCFDPIHLGHLHIAHEILRLSSIKEVLFIPNGKHNFKKDSIILDYDNRYELVRQAIEDQPGFAISDQDKAGTGYTAHLMQKLQAENPGQNYAFVIGSDNLAGLHKWYDFPWLRENLCFLILPRPGYEIKEAYLLGLQEVILNIELSPISSTEIRTRIARDESIQYLVPHKLEHIICELYRNKPTE